MKTAVIDSVAKIINDGLPHIGSETEGIVTNTQTLEVIHTLNGQQSTEAVKRWIKRQSVKGSPDFPDNQIDITKSIDIRGLYISMMI